MLHLESVTGAKFTVEFETNKPINDSRVLLRFLKPGEDGWMYYAPNTKFKDICGVITHLEENVETNGTYFIVSNLEEKL